MRRIIIGASREIEYDIRNDFSRACSRCRSDTTRRGVLAT